MRYLNMIGRMDFSSNPFWYCTGGTTINWISNMCSTLFILNMTSDRLYSIIRPHKAASFNTVKKAKLTILGSIIFSIFYNSPHLFITGSTDGNCIPYGTAMEKLGGQIYYWLSYVFSFALPFFLLLLMNTVIIHILRKRSMLNLGVTGDQDHTENEGQTQSQTIKKSEKQVYATLLLVTFGFLILITPAYMTFLYANLIDYRKSPHTFAAFTLFFSISQKAYYTNYGINFFFYVISGQKFRSDLKNLFTRTRTWWEY